MLAAHQRLRSSAQFRHVMRTGVRSGRRTVVVYLARTGDAHSIAGFAVSRAVGNAVVRNGVKRRLRAIAREILTSVDDDVAMVVRALPAAASVSYDRLRDDVSAAAMAAYGKLA